jgi:hypothetical protein
MLGRFNRAPGSADPTTAAQMGDGFLMRDGYTLVWVGWQFDVAAPGLRVEAPSTDQNAHQAVVAVSGPVKMSFILNEKTTQATLTDLPSYHPVNGDPEATLTVRNLFWERPKVLPRASWRFDTPAPNGRPRLILDSGFEPGRVYEIEFNAAGERVAGVGMAAIRDAELFVVPGDALSVHRRRAAPRRGP